MTYFARGESQCPTCGLLFTSVTAFDLHLLPRSGCRHPETVVTGPKSADPGRRLLWPRTRKNPDGAQRVVWGGEAWEGRYE